MANIANAVKSDDGRRMSKDMRDAVNLSEATLERDTRLLRAVSSGDMVAFHASVAEGANINCGVDFDVPIHWTPLTTACINGKLEFVRELIRMKADVRVPETENGGTPLYCASFAGNKDIVELLLGNGAESTVNTKKDDGCTPLMAAAINGYVEVVKLLLQAGADTSLTDDNGKTAKEYAEDLGRDDLAQLIGDHVCFDKVQNRSSRGYSSGITRYFLDTGLVEDKDEVPGLETRLERSRSLIIGPSSVWTEQVDPRTRRMSVQGGNLPSIPHDRTLLEAGSNMRRKSVDHRNSLKEASKVAAEVALKRRAIRLD